MVSDIQEQNEINFPKRAVYRRKKNRLYSMNDFQDGSEVIFYTLPEKPSSARSGYAWYLGQAEGGFGQMRLVHISELEPYE